MASTPPATPAHAGDGPVRVRAEVLDHGTQGPYHTLSLAAPAIAAQARPGQFVEIAVQAQHTLLRRPFSIARAGSRGAPGIVDVVFDAHGPGTEWLAALTTRSHVDVIGPLGTWFRVPDDGAPCLVVGGGYGVAPLFLLADDLRVAGCRVDFVAGAATEERLFNVIEAKRMAATATFTTEDGSFGTRGRVTDVMMDLLQRHGARHVYACGPMGMLRAVTAICAEAGVSSQLAVEEHMACGVGVCWTCVVPTRLRGEDEVRNRRSCIDGPVFDGAEIAWDETRWAGSLPTWLAGDVDDRADAGEDAATPRPLPPPPPAAPRPVPAPTSAARAVAPTPVTRPAAGSDDRLVREREERERLWAERERERQERRERERERIRAERERYELERAEFERQREERRAREAEERARREAERLERLEREREEREARRAQMEAERARMRAEREARLAGAGGGGADRAGGAGGGGGAADDRDDRDDPDGSGRAQADPVPHEADGPNDHFATQEIVRDVEPEPEQPLFGGSPQGGRR